MTVTELQRIRTYVDIPRLKHWRFALASGFKSDGATHAPDHIYGVSLVSDPPGSFPPGPADLHDYRYWKGGHTEAERFQSDIEFLIYMLVKVETESWRITRIPARSRALKYFQAVRAFGESHYHFHTEEP